MSADPPLIVHLSQSCHVCRVSRSTSHSPVSTFAVSAGPPLELLSPLLSCQRIHLSQSCLQFVVSADPPLAVLSPLLSRQQIHLLQSCLHFCRVSISTSRSPVSSFVVRSCQQIHLSQYCLHFCCVSRLVLSLFLSCQQIHLSQSCLHFCRFSRSTSCRLVSTFVMSADPPLAVLSPLFSCQQIHLSHVSTFSDSSHNYCRISGSTPQSHLVSVSRYKLSPVSTLFMST